MSSLKVGPSGPEDASVMFIGEAPGKTEVEQRRPFVGSAGLELTRMMHEAGFIRSECFITNVAREQPYKNDIDHFFGKKSEGLSELNGRYPKREILEGLALLQEEISRVKPKLIIPLGNTALWAITGRWGISDWRGSIMQHSSGAWVVPTLHPASILRDWSNRAFAVLDLKRAKKLLDGKLTKPTYRFHVAPTLVDTLGILDWMIAEGWQSHTPLHLSVDIETRHRQIACIGFAWSKQDAFCIPLLDDAKPGRSYWSETEELIIVEKLRMLFLHPRIRFSGQNFLYDLQYIAKQFGVLPPVWRDTMLIHHTCYPGIPKSLDFLSSFYLEWHEYWKHEGKEWERGMPEQQLWEYNCKDAVITWEIAELQTDVLRQINLPRTEYGTPDEIQMSLVPLVLETMLRGIRIDMKLKRELIMELDGEIAKRQEWINYVVGSDLNVRSPKQLQELFYEQLGQKVVIKYKTGRPTTDEEALNLIAEREPLLSPLVTMINELRQLSVAQSFCGQALELDNRMRCSYNVAGTETFRFASSEDAFGYGTNLQNITKGSLKEKEHWEAANPGKKYEGFYIPNLRRLFQPDSGYLLGEFDLKAADAQVVAAEAGEWDLLAQLLDPHYDLHSVNAERWGLPRQVCKGVVHGTNYGGTPYGLSRNLGIKEAHADRCQQDWFSRYPGIKQWHDRIHRQLMLKRFVENRFGYRRVYFDRIDDLLKEALAWIPQSTVAIVTNLGIRNVKANVPGVQFLLQTHDAAAFQWPSHRTEIPALIQSHMKLPIPYDRPLVIDVDFKVSAKSWGDVK